MTNKVSDRVRIYEDPITEQKKEGWAILRRNLSRDGGIWEGRTLESWMVQFAADEPQVCRSILSPRQS